MPSAQQDARRHILPPLFLFVFRTMFICLPHHHLLLSSSMTSQLAASPISSLWGKLNSIRPVRNKRVLASLHTRHRQDHLSHHQLLKLWPSSLTLWAVTGISKDNCSLHIQGCKSVLFWTKKRGISETSVTTHTTTRCHEAQDHCYIFTGGDLARNSRKLSHKTVNYLITKP
jgi:hypothetical protein